MIATHVNAPQYTDCRDKILPVVIGQTFCGHSNWKPHVRYVLCHFVDCKNLHVGSGFNELVDCLIHSDVTGSLTLHGNIDIEKLRI